jgi:hypothetical protein
VKRSLKKEIEKTHVDRRIFWFVIGLGLMATTLPSIGADCPEANETQARKDDDASATALEVSTRLFVPNWLNELKAGISAWMKQQGDDGHLIGEGIKNTKTEFGKLK